MKLLLPTIGFLLILTAACTKPEEIAPLPENIFENPLPEGIVQFTSFETNRTHRGVWTYWEFDGSIFPPEQLELVKIGIRTPINEFVLGQDVPRTIEQYDITDNIEGDLVYQIYLTNAEGTSSTEVLDELIVRFEP